MCVQPAVVVSNDAPAALKATLETNLPTLEQVKARSVIATSAISHVSTDANEVALELSSLGADCAAFTAQFADNLGVASRASANVQAAFSASATVAASAVQ